MGCATPPYDVGARMPSVGAFENAPGSRGAHASAQWSGVRLLGQPIGRETEEQNDLKEQGPAAGTSVPRSQ